MFAYAFTVDNQGLSGASLDCFADVSRAIGHTHKSYKAAETKRVAAAQRLGVDEASFHDIAQIAFMMGFRSRFTCGAGVFLIKSDDPLTRDDLDAVIAAKRNAGELESFLTECKI